MNKYAEIKAGLALISAWPGFVRGARSRAGDWSTIFFGMMDVGDVAEILPYLDHRYTAAKALKYKLIEDAARMLDNKRK